MGLETSIYTVLHGDSTVEALVGERIRPEVGYPEEDEATVTYTTTETPVLHSEGVASLQQSSISLTCYGRTKDECDSLFAAVKAEMEGTNPPRTFGDIYMQTLRRTSSDARAVAISETSENTPDWWIKSMEYFAVWH